MKKIIPILMALLIVLPAVNAQYTPLPISGEVEVQGSNAGIEVVIINDNSGEEVITHTNSNGFYLVDWANTEKKYRSGDQFTVKVAGKSKSVTYTGDPLEVNFGFPECPQCPSIPEDCPTTTTTIDNTPYAECDSCCPQLPEKEEDYFLEGFIALLAGGIGALLGYKKGPKKLKEYAEKHFKKGQYVRLGKYYNDSISAEHLHKGIVGYHDPEREHRDEDARHPKGELAGENVP